MVGRKKRNKIRKMKIVKKFVIFLLVTIIGISVYFQIKVELYRTNLDNNYDFSYLKQKRLRYTPLVFFLIQSKLYKKNRCYFTNINIPYTIYEEKNRIIRHNYEEYYIPYNIEYNAYLMYCYYELKELKCE